MPTRSSSRLGSGPASKPVSNAVLLETPQELADFLASLSDHGPIALDTEFVGEKSYWPSLELVQIADGRGTIGLVDCQEVRDLSPLLPLLIDATREKLVHAGSQDLAIFLHVLGHVPAPLFDTQLAAAMVGLGPQVSHSNLVRDVLGIKLHHGNQTVSDWSRRPFTKAQLAYAAEDVRHLHRLREVLTEKLEDLGRRSWFMEEQGARVREASISEKIPDDERYRTVAGWAKLQNEELAILRALAAWREHEARARNLPRKMVMSDDGLVTLCRLRPSTIDELNGLRGVPQGPLHRYKDQLLSLIQEAAALPRARWPKKNTGERRPPEAPAGMVELFQALVRSKASQEQIAPALLATTEDLQTLAAYRHSTANLDIPVLQGWRRQIIGNELLQLLNGQMCLRIRDRDMMSLDSD